MPIRKRYAKFDLALTLETLPSERGIHVIAIPIAEDERLTTERCTVVVRLWRESPNVIRGTISHGSGAIAHFQGGKPLAEFARVLRLRIERRAEIAVPE